MNNNQKRERLTPEQRDSLVMARTLDSLALLSVVKGCGSRCEVFNPSYELSHPGAQNCYDRCVDKYIQLCEKFTDSS